MPSGSSWTAQRPRRSAPASATTWCRHSSSFNARSRTPYCAGSTAGTSGNRRKPNRRHFLPGAVWHLTEPANGDRAVNTKILAQSIERPATRSARSSSAGSSAVVRPARKTRLIQRLHRKRGAERSLKESGADRRVRAGRSVGAGPRRTGAVRDAHQAHAGRVAHAVQVAARRANLFIALILLGLIDQ